MITLIFIILIIIITIIRNLVWRYFTMINIIIMVCFTHFVSILYVCLLLLHVFYLKNNFLHRSSTSIYLYYRLNLLFILGKRLLYRRTRYVCFITFFVRDICLLACQVFSNLLYLIVFILLAINWILMMITMITFLLLMFLVVCYLLMIYVICQFRRWRWISTSTAVRVVSVNEHKGAMWWLEEQRRAVPTGLMSTTHHLYSIL